jgi:hypothetical protein
MTSKSFKRLIIIIFALSGLSFSYGQFYNGFQMYFGKNRVQYYDYYWSFYRFEDIDCYFNENGRDLAQFTAQYAMKKLDEIEDYFDYTLEKRLILVIHNKQAEAKQSNIGLITMSDDDYNVGGYSRLIKNKVILYYEGDHIAYQKQIAESIVEAIINEMLAGADVRDRVANSSKFTIPDWYMKGLIKYAAYGWDYTAENVVKDGFRSGKYKKISHLENDDAAYAGQSFWRFLAKQYGDALIPNIIYLSKVYKNISDGFMYVVGQDLNGLLKEWQAFYLSEYSENAVNPVSDGKSFKRSRKEQIFQQVKMSPDKKYIAYVTNLWGRKKVVLYDNETGKSKVVFRTDPKYPHKTDNTYPVLAWHPNGRILTLINEEKALLRLYFYRVNEKSTEDRLLLYFDKVLDFSYSPDGTRFVFSAVKDGITDIYIHTISAGTNDQITRDIADDLNPAFLKNNGEKIIFTSNRLNDTLTNTGDPFERAGLTFDLFTYDLNKRDNLLTRLTDGQYNDRFQPASTGKTTVSYIGNNNGVFNRYIAGLDSSISFIDTTTHFRYYIKSAPATNYDRNILYQDVTGNPGSFSEVVFGKGRHYVRKGEVASLAGINEKDIPVSTFRKEQTRLLHKADSIEQIRQWLLAEDRKRRDTLTKPLYEYYLKDEPINIRHYIFEKEKENYYEQLWRKDYMNIDLDTSRLRLPLIRIYEPSFYNNYIASQIDFSFLNASYQPYNQGTPYYNPGMNLMTRIGAIDLFENYKITGGFRFGFDFDSYEYLIGLENLKGKFDKQLIYHRQAYKSYSGDSLLNVFNDNVYISFGRPITPVLSLKGTLTYRQDKYVILSTDVNSLSSNDIFRRWVSLKGEVIYDNTIKPSINIYYGTRFKIFGEYYREIPGNKSDMVVLGIDFRHYLRIHRELIWANRFAASASYGPTKLLYYLGGVDNWMGYYWGADMFNYSIPIQGQNNYGFQAIATNMRGFSQNIRNGNKFALINSELRWPFVLYLAGHPLRSNFLNSLQLVGFGDIGTAWTGKSPWSGENAYDSQVIRNGPVVVTLDSNREPIVAGFGGGLRAQLFGYFVRADLGWGIENKYILPAVFYLSLSLDF